MTPTPGQAALAEAARMEAARVYGTTVPSVFTKLCTDAETAIARFETRRPQPRSHDHPQGPLRRSAMLEDVEPKIDAALRAGRSASWVMGAYGVDYATVRAARKRLMAGKRRAGAA